VVSLKYSKLPLSFEAQADRLINRGLIADRQVLIKRLEYVSYYRLSGYLYPFRNLDDTYKTDTRFEHIWDIYTFDRQLRLLVLDAVERIEIAVRTKLIYLHTHKYGAFEYTNPETIPYLKIPDHTDFLNKLTKERKHSREVFVNHFLTKYGDCHQHLPFWMAAEIMTFGMLLTVLSGAEKSIRQQLAAPYNISEDVFLSWMRAIGGVRNICAHHSRLWNRKMGYQPLIPRQNKHPEWHVPIEIKGDKIFGLLTVVKYMLNHIAPQSKWPARLVDLLLRYPDVPMLPMGFAENWRDCPIWR
jgi:abortive infection bacteriophage resistance protein